MTRTNDTCGACSGYGGYHEDEAGYYPGWASCYHCRETGKCSCEECHPKAYDFTEADLALADRIMEALHPKDSGWAVYVTTPNYDNRDALTGTTTRLAAIFASEHSAQGWAMSLDHEDDDIRCKVLPCKFLLEALE